MIEALPLILISFNRGQYLRKTVTSYLRQTVPLEIFIHDNGSNDLDTLNTLSWLEGIGLKVFRRSAIKHAGELSLVNETVELALRGRVMPYAVSDCDVDISIARFDAFSVYLEILSNHPEFDCVGPMLRIADIPRSYPLFGKVMERHIEQFWGKQPVWISTNAGKVAVLPSRIDTTLAVYQAGLPYERHRSALRVYRPFEALHLDWYVDDKTPSFYRTTSAYGISHWDNASAIEEFRLHPTPETPYFTVEGKLNFQKICQRYAAENPKHLSTVSRRTNSLAQHVKGWRSFIRLSRT